MTIKKAIIHTDGGARGNPGPAAIGAVLEIDGVEHHFKETIGIATNNQAEYKAVILGLQKAVEAQAEEVVVYLDSELVQQQLMGNYKVKNKELAPLFVQVWNLAHQCKKVSYIHVSRNDNKMADRLVNEALDDDGSS